MLVTGLYTPGFNRIALLGAILGLAVNWFGDSLDGTLARVRGHQRPRYGFYVDHVVDCFGVLFVVSGLALAGYMSPLVSTGLLIAYFMLSIEIYLATYCLTVFRMSFWGVGPTELRILLAVGTLALWSDPRPEILGQQYRLFDVGGLVAIVSLALTLIVSVARNTRGAVARAVTGPAKAEAFALRLRSRGCSVLARSARCDGSPQPPCRRRDVQRLQTLRPTMDGLQRGWRRRALFQLACLATLRDVLGFHYLVATVVAIRADDLRTVSRGTCGGRGRIDRSRSGVIQRLVSSTLRTASSRWPGASP